MRNSVVATTQDRELAEGLLNRDETAASVFREEYASLLEAGYKYFTARVPGCRRGSDSLAPQVSFAAGRGFLRDRSSDPVSQTLGEYLERLHTRDLFHAAACLTWDAYRIPEPDIDPQSVAELTELIRKYVYPTIRGHFGDTQYVNDAINDLAGHVMMPGRDKLIRLAAFGGRCQLSSWLTTAAFNLVVNRQRASSGKDESLNEDSGQPKAADKATFDETNARTFIQHFFVRINELIDGVKDEERLEKLARRFTMPSNTRKKYADGLTESQKTAFHLLYFKGLAPSEVAELRGVSRSRISELIREYRERLAVLAFDVVEDLADVSGVSRETIIEMLDKLLDFLQHSEWEKDYRMIQESEDPFRLFVANLRRNPDETACESR